MVTGVSEGLDEAGRIACQYWVVASVKYGMSVVVLMLESSGPREKEKAVFVENLPLKQKEECLEKR